MRLGRTQATLLGAVFAVLAAGWMRPVSSVGGMPAELFFYRKMLWHHEFDVVCAGDSRTLLGVSPAAMRTVMGQRRIANFGFRLAGYSTRYAERAVELIDPATPRPLMLLGVDPHSLTTNAARNLDQPSTWMSLHPWRPGHFNAELENEFLWLAAQHPWEIRLQVQLGPLLAFFGRITTLDFSQLIQGNTRYPVMVAHEDGWFSSRFKQQGLERAVRFIPAMYAGNRVSPHVVAQLLKAVRRMQWRGIEVFGFRLPTDPRVTQLENQCSGFDEAALARDLAAAGGKWLPFDDRDFHTFDGHHLGEDEAVRFSTALARKVEASRERPGNLSGRKP
ncbi:MAG: hypothetical protein HYY25_14410 [Candidatus Wallbacteria bacterium]|nr:hypothetical protein [Candidatus Wallbacteria bacterium]